MRIEPPPSLAWASVTIPAATAAAAPPLEPPLERPGSQGLRVAPWASGSVVGRIPSSGVFVRPRITKPASRKRRASQVSSDSVQSRSRRKAMPSCMGSPAVWQARSLTRKGTPRNGPSAGSLASAFSKSGWITAFSSPSRASMRAMAASASSRGEASPERTSSACAVASTSSRSLQPPSNSGNPIGFWYFHPMEPVSAPPHRHKKQGSLENPEVIENVPGHIIPIIEREFDDFDNEAEKFLAGDTRRGPVHRLPAQAGRVRPAPGRRADVPHQAADGRGHARAARGVRRCGGGVRPAEQGPHHHAPEHPDPPHPAARDGRADPQGLRLRPLLARGLRQHGAQRHRRPVGGRDRGRAVRHHPLRGRVRALLRAPPHHAADAAQGQDGLHRHRRGPRHHRHPRHRVHPA